MSETVLLKCNAFEGMFSDEAVVELPVRDETESFIVERSAVEIDEVGNGRLKAELLTRGDERWVVLPTVYRDSIPFNAQRMVLA